MIGHIRRSWRLFASGRPGLRFRDRYHLHQSRRRGGGFGLFGLVRVVGGAALVLVSALFGWLPVLGWGTAILGLGMIAGECYPIACPMDRLEVGARKLLRPLGKAVVRLPTWALLPVALTISVSTFALVYGLCSLIFG